MTDEDDEVVSTGIIVAFQFSENVKFTIHKSKSELKDPCDPVISRIKFSFLFAKLTENRSKFPKEIHKVATVCVAKSKH